MTTKDKIISKATRYFNRNGFGAVTLLELSKEIGMSRGNLAYHFKDKDLLLKAIARQMFAKMETERSKSRQFPSFENLQNEVRLYAKFQKDYAFIFLDPNVMTHSAIKNEFQQMTRQTLADFKAAIAFSIKLGNMKPEPVPGMYHNVALTIWMLSFFWLSQQIVRGERSPEEGEKLIWSILIPHFTEKGVNSFKSFFGEDYYQNLGDPFEEDLNTLISF